MPILADLALKGTLVLLAALLAARLLRGAPAATRHVVWTSALAALLVMPAAALLLPAWRVELPRALDAALGAALDASPSAASPASPGAALDRARADGPSVGRPLAPRAAAPGAAAATAAERAASSCPAAGCDERPHAETAAGAATASRSAWLPSREAWLLAAWTAGAALVLLRLALGVVGVARLARRARPVADAAWLGIAARVARELGIRRPVTLLVTERRTVPLTWGVLYPVVLLPADAAGWDDERRRLVLLHELAHVRRLDALTHAVVQGALALAWFHPLAWLAARRVRVERELACDDVVLAHGTRPSRYADDLLEIARLLQAGRGAPGFGALALAPLAMARRSELEDRLRAILDPRRRRGEAGRRALLLAAVATGALVAPLVALRPASAAAQRPARAGSATSAPAVRPTAAAPVAPIAPIAPIAPAAPVVAPASFAAVAAAARDSVPTCRDGDGAGRLRDLSVGRGDTFLTHSDGRTTTHLIRNGDECVRLELRGAVVLGDDDGSLRARDDGWMLLAETADGVERVLVDRGGDRRFWVNGRTASVADGDAWLRAALPGLLRRTGFAAEQRVARLYGRGGTSAVLAELAHIPSDGVRRTYLATLLDRGTLDAGELTAVARETERLRSDGDQRLVLLALLEQSAASSAAVVDAVLAAARGLGSDGDRRLVLVALAPRVRDEQAARFAAVAREIDSDGDLRIVLTEWLEHGGSGTRAAPALLATAGEIGSDGDRRIVLAAAARRAPLDEPAVRDAYFAAAGGMRSGGERRLVLLAALEAGRLDAAGLGALLRSAAQIDGDSEKALVLVRAARHPALRDRDARAAFDAAARTIESESDYGRVMRAAGR